MTHSAGVDYHYHHYYNHTHVIKGQYRYYQYDKCSALSVENGNDVGDCGNFGYGYAIRISTSVIRMASMSKGIQQSQRPQTAFGRAAAVAQARTHL